MMVKIKNKPAAFAFARIKNLIIGIELDLIIGIELDTGVNLVKITDGLYQKYHVNKPVYLTYRLVLPIE